MIKNEALMQQKLKHIKQCGVNNVQVMCDFDQTITKDRFTDGEKADSTYKAIHDN